MLASTPLTSMCGWRCSANPWVAVLGDSVAKILLGTLWVGLGFSMIFNAVRDVIKWPKKRPGVDLASSHDTGTND